MMHESGRTGISSCSLNARLDFSLLRNLQHIAYLETEEANGAPMLGVTK